MVDGVAVHERSGRSGASLGRVEWNTSQIRGKLAQLGFVDEGTASWSHVIVDEIEQWAPR